MLGPQPPQPAPDPGCFGSSSMTPQAPRTSDSSCAAESQGLPGLAGQTGEDQEKRRHRRGAAQAGGPGTCGETPLWPRAARAGPQPRRPAPSSRHSSKRVLLPPEQAGGCLSAHQEVRGGMQDPADATRGPQPSSSRQTPAKSLGSAQQSGEGAIRPQTLSTPTPQINKRKIRKSTKNHHKKSENEIPHISGPNAIWKNKQLQDNAFNKKMYLHI